MKIRYKILIPVATVLVFGSFYMFIVLNGYSPYPQGMSLVYYFEMPQTTFETKGESEEYEITKITDENLADVPKLKRMLDVALDQEFPLHDDGFAVIDSGLNSYWLNMDYDENIRIQNSMTVSEVSEYRNWLSSNAESGFIEYKEKIFRISFWIA